MAIQSATKYQLRQVTCKPTRFAQLSNIEPGSLNWTVTPAVLEKPPMGM